MKLKANFLDWHKTVIKHLFNKVNHYFYDISDLKSFQVENKTVLQDVIYKLD